MHRPILSYKAPDEPSDAISPTQSQSTDVTPPESPIESEPIPDSDLAPLSWDLSVRDKIKKLSVNEGIRRWMEYDPAFADWVKTCVAQHVTNCTGLESVCPIPDRWREDIGESITVITSNCLPGKNGAKHEFMEGVYHVMA